MDWNSKQVKYSVNRNVPTYDLLIKRSGYLKDEKKFLSNVKESKCMKVCTGTVQQLIPIIEWLPRYSFKNNIIGDMVAGATVAIMHIPHGLAYGVLAGLAPANGLYMAIFPVLIYMIFGTSRHISIGTFAVVSLMTLTVVQTHAADDDNGNGKYTSLEVATALTLSVGIIHFLMAFFQLGIISVLLSEAVVGGFTAGSAVHVICNLIKDVLGVSVARHEGILKLLRLIDELVKKTPEANPVTVVFSLLIMIFMTIMNDVMKPWLKTKCSFPFPAELVAICGATLISRFTDINKAYDVILVGDIPNELPSFRIPQIEIVPLILSDAIAIAIVSYSVVMSLGLAFAKKHSYEIRPNQELFAMGLGNLVGACFSCIPMACSLSRSLIQEQTGGVTQITSLISAFLILITILWIGPFFSASPKCALASVIIIALKPMIMQARNLKIYAQHGNMEWMTWIITFFCVLVLDTAIGLFVGMVLSVITYIKVLRPCSVVLGIVPGYDAIYVNPRSHVNAIEVAQTKIFRYYGPLSFATKGHFRKLLYKDIVVKGEDKAASTLNMPRSVVLDFSPLNHIDGPGCRALSEIVKEMHSIGIEVFIANPTDKVYEVLDVGMSNGRGPFLVFPTLHDAVSVAIVNAAV